ncbi:MAG: DUF3299 domain-containing protein [Lysobacterales bacterium]
MESLRSWLLHPALIVAALTAVMAASAQEPVKELKWDDLVPAEEKAMAANAASTSSLDDLLEQASPAASPASTLVMELAGQNVRLPGFIVPLESDEVGLLSEFFLVPYFGACIHVPPPPPNQLVYVKLNKPFELKSLWDPFWVSGTMKAQGFESAMGQAGYTLESAEVAPYEWPE